MVAPTPAVRTTQHDIGGGRRVQLRQRDFHGSVRRPGVRLGDATGTTLWPSALPLLLHLQGLLPQVEQTLGLNRPVRVLEVGAGCGLLGIGLAASCGAHVTLTDADVPLDEGGTTLDWLTQNIELNRELIAASGGRAEPARLVWGDAADTAALEEPGGFDLVVGSDVLHLSEWHDELLSSVRALAGTTAEARRHVAPHPPRESDAVAVFGYQVRNGSERRFASGEGSGFAVEVSTLPPTPAQLASAKPGRNPAGKTVSHLSRVRPGA